MSARALTCAVVSTDAGFVEALRSSALFESGDFSVDAEIQAPYSDIADVDLNKLKSLAPDIVILDLESDFSIGLKFAEFLGDAGIGGVLVASGPPPGARDADGRDARGDRRLHPQADRPRGYREGDEGRSPQARQAED